MIELEGLTKRYGEKTAVNNLTFTVRPGLHVTGFLGPNGAGKSTTMRMMIGLDRPTAGDVRIDGKHYDQLKDPLTYIGALLDAKAMHGGRSAHNHLLCLAQSNGIPKKRVHEVLDTVGLTAVAKKKAKGFSLGMGQRLGIAGALLGDPRILMFDEPVNGLDPEGIHWIRNLMKTLAAQGRTVFVSSHLMSEMALTADHLVVIGQGQLSPTPRWPTSSRRTRARTSVSAARSASVCSTCCTAPGSPPWRPATARWRSTAARPSTSASWPPRTSSCCTS
ncbi:Bacitracin transport ATP-binding protein BcrA [Streptomyces alboniger]